MKVLVIYEIIPEETKKAIVEMDEVEYEYFRQSEGSIINGTENSDEAEEVNLVINNAFTDNPEYIKYCETEKQRDYFGKFKHQETIEDLTDVDRMIHCGFWL